MTMVLSVNRYTGEYDFLDACGKVLPHTATETDLAKEDVAVLIERIRQGYTHLSVGHYLVSIETHEGFNLSDAQMLQISNVLRFGLDDDGYPTYVSPSGNGVSVRLMRFDRVNNRIDWLVNPLLENQFVADLMNAPTVDPDDKVRMRILSDFIINRTKAESESALLTLVAFRE